MFLGAGGIPSNNSRRPDQGILSQNTTASRAEESESDTLHQDIKNKHISELSDMVKTLLDEQRALKEKVEMYENKMKSAVEGNSSIGIESSMLVRK